MRPQPLALDPAIDRVWRTGNATAGFVLTLVIAVAVFIYGSYEGRAERDAARHPVVTSEGGSDGVAYWRVVNDHIDFRYVDVVKLAVIDGGAAPPPGLAVWPQPGEVFVSPALDDLDPSGEVASQYGQIVGTIDEDGLANPAERFAYVGVDPAAVEAEAGTGFQLISGFGGEPGMNALGDVTQQSPMNRFIPPYLALLVVPAAFLLVVAVRLGGERRDRQIRMLAIVGSSPHQRRMEVVRATWRPAATGAALAGLIALVGTMTNWTVPGNGYVVVGGDVRPLWWALGAGVVLATGLTILAAVALLRLRRGPREGSTRPVAGATKATTWPVLLLPAMVALANLAYVFLAPSNPYLGLLAYMAATIGAVICMPAFVAALTSLISRWAVWVAKRHSAPSMLIAGRSLQASARPVIRAVMIVAVAMVLVTQIHTFTSAATEEQRRAQEAYDHANQSFVTIAEGETPQWLTAYSGGLPAGRALLRTATDVERGTTIVWGACADLTAIFGSCPTSPEPVPPVTLPRGASLGSFLGEDASFAVADPLSASAAEVDPVLAESSEVTRTITLVVSTTREPVTEREVRTDLNALTVEPPFVDVAGTLPWLMGAEIAKEQTRWVGYLGAIGLLFCVAATLLGLGLEFLEIGRRLAPVSILTGARSSYTVCATVIVGVPIVVAGAVGITVGWASALAPTAPGELASLPVGVLLAMGGGAVLLAAVFVPVCVAAIGSRASVWTARDTT